MALEINIIVFLNLSGLWRWQWFPCLFDLLHDPVFKMHFTVWLKLIWWKRYLCTMRDFQILSTTLILHTLFIIRIIYLLRSSFVAKLNTDENEKYESIILLSIFFGDTKWFLYRTNLHLVHSIFFTHLFVENRIIFSKIRTI